MCWNRWWHPGRQRSRKSSNRKPWKSQISVCPCLNTKMSKRGKLVQNCWMNKKAACEKKGRSCLGYGRSSKGSHDTWHRALSLWKCRIYRTRSCCIYSPVADVRVALLDDPPGWDRQDVWPATVLLTFRHYSWKADTSRHDSTVMAKLINHQTSITGQEQVPDPVILQIMLCLYSLV